MPMILHISKILENLTKTADQLLRCQMSLVLELATSAFSNAVSHNGTMKALFVSRLTTLIM